MIKINMQIELKKLISKVSRAYIKLESLLNNPEASSSDIKGARAAYFRALKMLHHALSENERGLTSNDKDVERIIEEITIILAISKLILLKSSKPIQESDRFTLRTLSTHIYELDKHQNPPESQEFAKALSEASRKEKFKNVPMRSTLS